jgi:hypothetical protein
VASLMLAGCGATMVNRPGAASGSEFAPVNEAQRPGMVSYLNQGLGAIVRARRENAYKQMHDACAGPYRIDGEGPHSSGGVITPVGSSAVITQSQYWFIQFSCITPPVPTAAPTAPASPARAAPSAASLN